VVFLAVVGVWLLLAPVAAWAVGEALRMADRAERSTPDDGEGTCPPAGETAASGDASAAVPVRAEVAQA
jgi:hypothetical protein